MILCKECGDEIESGRRRTCWKCERDKKATPTPLECRQTCRHCRARGHNIRTCGAAAAWDSCL